MTKQACCLLMLCAAVAACKPEPEPRPGNFEAAANEASGRSGGAETISCALGGTADFEQDCAVERSVSEGLLELTVRHPDGGFRRFVVLDDGRGLAVADGAQQAVTRYEDGFAEVAIGTDRYRFPATQAGNAARP